MATMSFTFPAEVAGFLNANVPGFSAASGGGATMALEVPVAAVPGQVAAGLADAGFRLSPEAGAGAPDAAPEAVAVGLGRFTPAGLAPQGDALHDPALAGANAAAARDPVAFGQAMEAFFQQAAANPPPADPAAFASWAAAQQQAAADYFGGL